MSSVSRAELEAMGRDELIEQIAGLEDRVNDLEGEVSRLDTIAIRAIERAKDAQNAADDLADRVDALEAENKRLRSRLDEDQSKEDKVGNLVEYASNKRNHDQAVVALSPQEIKGAYGCSRRYAYNLVDNLPEEYHWILSGEDLAESQYGSIEREVSKAGKRIGIDIEGVHSAGCPVNHFITGNSSGGGEN